MGRAVIIGGNFGWALIGMATALLLIPTTAMAQDDSDATIRARQQFEAGVAASEAGHLQEAADAYERSLATLPSPSAAFNLALVEDRLGRILSAIGRLEQVLSGAYGALDAEGLARVEEAIEAMRTDLAHVEIRVSGPPRATLVVDAEATHAVTRDRPVDLRLDPGTHRLELRAEGHIATQRELRVARAERASITIPLDTAAPTPRIAPPAPDPTRDMPRTLEEADDGGFPWGWVVGGLGVVLAAASVIAIVLWLGGGAEPTVDPITGNAQAFR